jgi:hypothetical protein
MVYICSPRWELSSVGSEHLPYKQGVAGSNPAVPTKKSTSIDRSGFFIIRKPLKLA